MPRMTSEEKRKFLNRAKYYQKNIYKIPRLKGMTTRYSKGIENKHLIPSKELMNKAFKKCVQRYEEYVKTGRVDGYSSNRVAFVYSYAKIENGSVLYWEFIYKLDNYIKNKRILTHENNQFQLLEAIDFGKKVELYNEKKQYTGPMGGYKYFDNYSSFVFELKLDKLKTPGSLFSSDTELDESFKNIKINDYFTLEGPKSGRMIQFEYYQRILNLNPEHVETIYKWGYKNIFYQKISQKKYDFLRKRTKFLPKNITKRDLDIAYTLHKAGVDFKNWEIVKKEFGLESNGYYGEDRFGMNKFDLLEVDYRTRGYRDFPFGSEKKSFTTANGKIIKRILNLLETGESWHELNTFAGACFMLGLNQNKEILKGKKERDKIVEQYEEERKAYKILLSEQERQRILMAQKEQEEKYKEFVKTTKKTLPEVTKNFLKLDLDDFEFIPIKDFKEFTEISEELDLCLITNGFYKKVAKENSIIYIAVPKGMDRTKGEVIEWKIEGEKEKRITVSQIHGYDNKNTKYYEKIKELANSLKYEDLVQKQI